MASLKTGLGNRDHISLDDVCNLLQTETIGTDPLGQPILQEKAFMVFCSKLSITRAEFSTAGQLGHKPDMILIVDADSYDDEKNVEYKGKKYSVYKSYMRNDGFTEIFCEVNASDRH